MKIYTKTGDGGETGLIGGLRVSKSHGAIEVCGSLDETNCLIGMVLSGSLPDRVKDMLNPIQNDLFEIGSRIAASAGDSTRVADFPNHRILQLENWIDEFQSRLPELTAFIMPGGGQGGAVLHLARSVCRRTERRLVQLIESGTKRDLNVELIYLNRLSDLLFVIARHVNLKSGQTETKWAGISSSE